MLLSAVKKILSIVMVVVLTALITVPAFAEDKGPGISSVMWPCEVPFKIIVPRNNDMNMQGMIYSEEFEIVNMGDNDVEIEINAARIEIESDDGGYNISDTDELPESGSNIFIELVCLDEEEAFPTVLSDDPSDAMHTYHLKSGEVGKFKFDGTVNEIDGPAWDDTVVKIHMSFNIVGMETAADEEEADEPQNDEDVTRDDSGENEASGDEASTPNQESGPDADDKETQESQPDTHETDDDVADSENPPDDSPGTESGQEEHPETD